VYGQPAARFGIGELARVEMYVNTEKDGEVQRIYLEGNIDPQRVVELGCKPAVIPAQEKREK
jgi:hypothetical protein